MDSTVVLDPYRLIRPLLFTLDPETAHHATLRLLAILGRFLPRQPPHDPAASRSAPAGPLAVPLGTMVLPNPVGLAAGFDKDAVAVGALARLGFGFIEVGTVTPLAQPGNPRPRLFRLPRRRAIINRLGFNSPGAAAVRDNLARRPSPTSIVLGANIGPNRATPPDRAWEDYAACLSALYPLVDYFTLNVSSPNTPGLRGLQAPERLDALLARVQAIAGELGEGPGQSRRPLFLKLSPDLDTEGLVAGAHLAIQHKLAGLVLTNTTIRRPGLDGPAIPEGGLSGAPLAPIAREALECVRRAVGGSIPIISVGGIMDEDEAWMRLQGGAAAIQLYTGLVYEGPGLVSRILRRIGPELARSRQASLIPPG